MSILTRTLILTLTNPALIPARWQISADKSQETANRSLLLWMSDGIFLKNWELMVRRKLKIVVSSSALLEVL